MQTFVPFADFKESARVLDQKRAGKQRVETFQVMQALAQSRLVSPRTEVYVPTRGRNAGKPTNRSVPLPREQWQIYDTKVGWDKHKVTNMWRGHELALLMYQLDVCADWVDRGYKDTCFEKTRIIYEHMVVRDNVSRRNLSNFDQILEDIKTGVLGISWPKWLGDERVHASHRAALKFKAPEFYDRYGWDEEAKYEYFWPPESEVTL